MKRYERANPDDEATILLAEVIEQYHPLLHEEKVRVEIVWIEDDLDPRPLKHHGVPAMAVAKVIPLKDRYLGRGDAEITIDRQQYEELENERQRKALLDHELEHFRLKRDAFGSVAQDGAGRPKLTTRHHDVQFGWFRIVAERWKEDSMERLQAKRIEKEYGQAFFEFMEAQPSLKIVG